MLGGGEGIVGVEVWLWVRALKFDLEGVKPKYCRVR